MRVVDFAVPTGIFVLSFVLLVILWGEPPQISFYGIFHALVSALVFFLFLLWVFLSHPRGLGWLLLFLAGTVGVVFNNIVSFALAYWAMAGVENAISGLDHLYFSVVTFTTLGYGDLLPIGGARVYASIQAMLGFLFLPLLLSQLVVLIHALALQQLAEKTSRDDS